MNPDEKVANEASDVVLDTCCLVNLAAIDGTLECLAVVGLTWYIPTAVQAEGIFIRSGTDTKEVRQIDLIPSITAGIVRVCAPADEVEQALYVKLAMDLDDGEAMALAIAKSRGWKLATDDRKARNMAASMGVVVLTTPQLLERWASGTNKSKAETADAIRRIESLARFTPPDNSPGAEWWRNNRSEDNDADE
jgi:predicted nucleic acid-binding protein